MQSVLFGLFVCSRIPQQGTVQESCSIFTVPARLCIPREKRLARVYELL